jgi:arylsulfatase A-like enzyme
MSSPRSLILITVDCLRFDHVGFNGYGRPTTPFLDQLAKESTVVRNPIVAGAPTYYSFPAIMASRHPLALGRDVVGLAPGEPTIASVLNGSGYATAAFIAGNPYLSRRFGYDAGFESFEDFLGIDPISEEPSAHGEMNFDGSRLNRALAELSHRLGPLGQVYDELYFRYCHHLDRSQKKSLDQLRRYPAADIVVDRASDWLSDVGGRPFFLWLHLMDPHSPYYPAKEAWDAIGQGSLDSDRAHYLNSYWNRTDLKEWRLKRHREEIIALYDAGIRWVDTQIGRLTQALRGLRLWDNCVFALTADHGEEFLEHGGRYHHPSKLTDELVRVPLLLRVPGGEKNTSADEPFSLVHLAPTLLEAMDHAVPAGFRGRSRWTQLQNGQNWDGPEITECIAGCNNPYRLEERVGARILAARDSQYQLVLDFRTGKAELFDLKADPKQRSPLPPDAAKRVRRSLLEAAREHVARSIRSRNEEDLLRVRLREVRLEWAR